MKIEIRVPAVGESITEGLLAEWLKADGAAVKSDEPLFVLETDKVTLTVNSETSGTLSLGVRAGEGVKVGQVIGFIDTAGAAEAVATSEQAPGAPLSPPAGLPQMIEKMAVPDASDLLSPAARRMAEEYGISAAEITGTGRGGRITKEDVARHIKAAAAGGSPPTGDVPPPEKTAAAAPQMVPVTAAAIPPGRQTRTPMTPMRQRIAQRLLAAKNSAAILTTFNEADMSALLALRAKHRDAFREKHGVDLGLMSFFVRASVEALKAVPQLNAQIDGTDIVQNHYYDIGVAVGTERGLVVPVIRDCDRLSFAEIEAAIATLAGRVRDKRISLSDLEGGVFTVSNGGVYGNLLSTPILNPPQSGILGMHTIKKRPVAVGDAVVVRPMMYLALSYDHRIVDGREAVAFLKRVVECVEDPERMLLDV